MGGRERKKKGRGGRSKGEERREERGRGREGEKEDKGRTRKGGKIEKERAGVNKSSKESVLQISLRSKIAEHLPGVFAACPAPEAYPQLGSLVLGKKTPKNHFLSGSAPGELAQ